MPFSREGQFLSLTFCAQCFKCSNVCVVFALRCVSCSLFLRSVSIAFSAVCAYYLLCPVHAYCHVTALCSPHFDFPLLPPPLVAHSPCTTKPFHPFPTIVLVLCFLRPTSCVNHQCVSLTFRKKGWKYLFSCSAREKHSVATRLAR